MYEFVLSHLLAALLGGMLLRYTTTVALYIAALGGGAYLVDKVFFRGRPQDQDGASNGTPNGIPNRTSNGTPNGAVASKASAQQLVGALWRVELMLSLAGAVAPALALLSAGAPGFISQWVCYMLVCGVGVLSGFELPLLMRLGELQRKGHGLKVLSFDFMGTCVGCVMFPLLLLPYLGVFYTAALASSVNLIIAIGLVWGLRYARRELPQGPQLPQSSPLPQEAGAGGLRIGSRWLQACKQWPCTQWSCTRETWSWWVMGKQKNGFKRLSCKRGAWGWWVVGFSNVVAILLWLWPRAQNFIIESFYF